MEGSGLRLYNTLGRKKEAFVPLDPGNVRMYVCGPTVYDYAHVGNARPAIVFDVLFRLLRNVYGSGHVTYARNITDVDDKINARAARDYPHLPLNEAIARVTAKTADQFHEDVAALGCLNPTHEPRATDFVQPRGDGLPDMVGMIAVLMAKGHAYEAGGEVLFDIASMDGYGRLSGRDSRSLKAGARVAVEGHKKNHGDFVLWKRSAPDEPGWESPWGRGRPGWHIECSVMSAAYLGEVFDIHGGGLDLIFPHHENEIAQSRCAHGTHALAGYWMHNGFVQVEGRKMSKSEGNFVTIHELLRTDRFGGRAWDGDVLRLAMLMTHYREPLDFSVRRLEEAEALLGRACGFLSGAAPGVVPEGFAERMADDLNTPAALNWLFSSRKNGSVTGEGFSAALGLLGISPARATAGAMPDFDRTLIGVRLAHIAAKQWAEADRIRDMLLEQGVRLKDGKDPATGERVTEWEALGPVRRAAKGA